MKKHILFVIKKTSILLIISFVLLGNKGISQELSGLFLYNKLAGLYNPSSIPNEYSNYNQNLVFGASARSQWTKLPSTTQTIKLEYIAENTENTFSTLYGTYILNDRVGQISSTGIYFKMASFMSKYNSTFGGISAGIQFGAIQYRINSQSLREKYPNDILTYSNSNKIKPELSLGVSYYNIIKTGILKQTQINVGLSIAELGFNQLNFTGDSNEFSYYITSQFYGYSSVKKHFKNNKAIELNAWVQYVKDVPINIDLRSIFYLNEEFWLEVGLNTSGIGHFGFGINFFDFFGNNKDLINMNYSFNPTFIKFGSVFGNTHELSVSYSL